MWRTMRRMSLVLAALAILSGCQGKAAAASLVREEAAVMVGQVKEVWQLVWDKSPTSICGPEDLDEAVTCPCSGFSFGEEGRLSLVRKRSGREIERLNLGPFFEGSDTPHRPGSSLLQRWPVHSGDFDHLGSDDPELVKAIKQRPVPKVMNFADYNHDGQATEFLLQVDTAPCGKHEMVAVGVSAKDPHLHALSSIEGPAKPLVMTAAEWATLLKGPGEHQIVDWACGDHGSEEEQDLIISASNGGIDVRHKHYACENNRNRGNSLPERKS